MVSVSKSWRALSFSFSSVLFFSPAFLPAPAAFAGRESVAEGEFRYEAFISYRHVEPDRKWAMWMHTALETYRVPKKLAAERGLPRLGRTT